MTSEIKVICNTLKVNTRLCINCFKDVDENIAQKRISDSVNSMSFILVHMLDARYFMARIAGVHLTNPYKELLKTVKNNDEYLSPPPIKEILDYWQELSELLEEALKNSDESELMKETKFNFPNDDKTKLGNLIFLTEHDSYHLGQLGLLRKLHGLESMSYS